MNWKTCGIFAGLCALLLRFIFSLSPEITETIYSRGIFVVIRYVLDYTIGLIPFPLLYPLIVLLFLVVIWKIGTWWRYRQKNTKKEAHKKTSWKKRMRAGLLAVAGGIGIVMALGYFIWGFNYWRLPIEKHLHLKLEPLDSNRIRSEAELALKMMVHAKRKMTGTHFVWSNLETEVRGDLERVLKSFHYPTPGRVRGRYLAPGQPAMYFGVSGFYNFFTGEAYVPATLLAMEIPFTLAHEMAHGYGFCEEGTANFLAYLTCLSSHNPLIQYSGCYHYFMYISSDLYRVSSQEYSTLLKQCPPDVSADVRAIQQNWARYRGFLMELGQVVNDVYLKGQGIKEGVKSYNRLLVLVAAWKNSPLSTKNVSNFNLTPIKTF